MLGEVVQSSKLQLAAMKEGFTGAPVLCDALKTCELSGETGCSNSGCLQA